VSLAFLGTSFRRRSVALAKAGKLVSLRNGVKRRNLLDSNQAVRALPAAAGQPPHPFAAQHDDSHSSRGPWFFPEPRSRARRNPAPDTGEGYSGL